VNIFDTRENLNAMVLNHEQQIKDIAAHLLELKQLVTPMMEFKPEKSLQEPVAWLVTYGGLTHVEYTQPTQVVDTHYQPLYTAPLAEQKPMPPEIKKMYEDYFDKCFRESSAQEAEKK